MPPQLPTGPPPILALLEVLLEPGTALTQTHLTRSELELGSARLAVTIDGKLCPARKLGDQRMSHAVPVTRTVTKMSFHWVAQ